MDLGSAVDGILESRGRTSEPERLRALAQACWEQTLADTPELATEVGASGHNHRWTDLRPEAIARRKRALEQPLRGLAGIDRGALAADDQLSYDLLKRDTETALAGRDFPAELLPLDQMAGAHQEVARTLSFNPARTTGDFEDMLARLEAVPALMAQTIELLRAGLARGITPPRITLRDVPQQVLEVIGGAAPSPLLAGFVSFPDSVPAADAVRLRAAAETAMAARVAPALRALHAFLVQTYIPQARESVGWHALPDGEAWYAWSAARHTTTRLTPAEIHAIGRSEVQRIRAALDAVMAEAGFSGTFAECAHHLRTDARFYHTDAGALLRGYRDICKRADAELPRLFSVLPRLTYGVSAVPAHAEKSQTTAYYESGSLAAGRAAQYYANTYALHTRPIWEMEALSLHEAVPGHHLQIALAQELTELPEFRRHARYTAYIEGWGLYAESLGAEMGFYRDPWSRFGALTYEIWRAIRLVVDTGIHALGWTRDQAIAYFADNSSKSEHDIVVEIDRYIVWPGQALAYKIGELKIRELRTWARAQLGAGFDVRGFHDQVLGAGALPLDVLEARIRAWVDAQHGGPHQQARQSH